MNKLIEISKGYWFYPVEDFVYDENYIKKYEGYSKTKMGKCLLRERLNILKPYKKVIDVGVGSGDILVHKTNSKGYDVNPVMVTRLKKANKWCDIYKEDLSKFDAISFFDSFEHIKRPQSLLERISNQTLIIAMPIYYDYDNLLKSKHFRPDEHFHYFTFYGLLEYMESYGFTCWGVTDIEVKLGREAIYTFLFRRSR